MKICELHVAAINTAIEGIPRDRVRLHCCWGNWEGPHVHDIALAPILPVLYQAHAGALTIEFANPRHQHEYEALRAHPLPKDWLLIPGVIDTTTNFVEHPRVVARRIARGRRHGRRARAGDRLHRLRLRHLRGPRMGGGAHRLEETRRPREGADIASAEPVGAGRLSLSPVKTGRGRSRDLLRLLVGVDQRAGLEVAGVSTVW